MKHTLLYVSLPVVMSYTRGHGKCSYIAIVWTTCERQTLPSEHLYHTPSPLYFLSPLLSLTSTHNWLPPVLHPRALPPPSDSTAAPDPLTLLLSFPLCGHVWALDTDSWNLDGRWRVRERGVRRQLEEREGGREGGREGAVDEGIKRRG